MDILLKNLENCQEASGVVVVIDVLRAFSTAAYALAAGAHEILLVSSVGEALALRGRFPDSLVMGEVNGLKPLGFDLGNSPADIINRGLVNMRLIQRTGAGTQGVVRSIGAAYLWAASFVCASATVRAISLLKPQAVTFIITGVHKNWDGDEDIACADYMTALLRGEQPDIQPYLERVSRSTAGQKFLGGPGEDFSRDDLELAIQADRFGFAMPVERRDGLLVLHRQQNPGAVPKSG